MPTFPTPAPVSIAVDLWIGDLRVIGANVTETTVDVRPASGSAADARAAELMRAEHISDLIVVHAPKDWKRYTWFSNDGSVDVTVTVPAGSSVNATGQMTQVRCEGALGEVAVKTSMGAIRVDSCTTLQAKSGHGDVTVAVVAGDASATTGSGRITLGEVGGSAKVWNSNGDSEIDVAHGPVVVKSPNGGARIRRAAGGSVQVKAAVGTIVVDELATGSATLTTSTGGIEVGIPAGAAAWVDADTKYGRVHSALDPTDAPQPDAPSVQVRAHTSYGDITIRRATA